jgi:4-amino-4-deoxy-L-arabinose transferase-like glycosyltransferase
LKISFQYKGFLILSGLLLVFNLLIVNDFVGVLAGAETNNIYFAQQYIKGVISSFDPTFHLPMSMLIINYGEIGFNLFLLRLPNVLLLILSLLGFFWWGKKLFGMAAVLLTILVVSSTFLVVPISKFVVNDIWLLVFQLMSFLSLILFLKQPVWKWRVLFWGFTILAVWVNPVSALVFSFGMWLFLLIAHPNRKNLINIFDVLIGVVICSTVYFFIDFKVFDSGFFFSYSHTNLKHYFLFHLVSVLPWIAFLPAAIFDLFQKLRKREEMAIILFGFLLFSILSYGLVLQIAFALLIAKQVENYFKPSYPHANLVKSFAILNLLFSFALVAFLMLTGYDTFAEIGFRSRMGVGCVYWAFSFLTIIGLFGKSKKMIVGGMVLCGSLTMLLFWTQIVPLLENYRNLPEKLAIAIDDFSTEKETPVYIQKSFYKDSHLPERNQIYFSNKAINYIRFEEVDSIKNSSGIFVLDDVFYNKLDSAFVNKIEKTQVIGRDHVFDAEQKIWVLKK